MTLRGHESHVTLRPPRWNVSASRPSIADPLASSELTFLWRVPSFSQSGRLPLAKADLSSAFRPDRVFLCHLSSPSRRVTRAPLRDPTMLPLIVIMSPTASGCSHPIRSSPGLPGFPLTRFISFLLKIVHGSSQMLSLQEGSQNFSPPFLSLLSPLQQPRAEVACLVPERNSLSIPSHLSGRL